MKPRGLFVAIAILAGLCGVLYWSNHHPPAEKMPASDKASPRILSLKEEDISRINIRKKDGPELTLAKDEGGKWQITAPSSLPVEQNTVSPMLATLSSLTSDRVIEENATNPGAFGLDHPVLVADVREKNNRAHKLLFGDDTPTGNAVYAQLEGDARVFTVAGYVRRSLDKSPNELRDKRLLTVDPEKITTVELVVKQEHIEFARNQDGWQIVKPKAARADGFQVEDLVRTLADARMDLSDTDDPRKTASAFAAAVPLATAKVTDAAGTQELQVRRIKDVFYAKSSAVEGIFKVPNSLGNGLDKKFEDFRDRKLFDFAFNNPDKIELHDRDKSYFLTRNGSDWWNAAGRKMDVNSVASLLEKIRALSAEKFPDSGFTAPQIMLNVTGNDGKRMEKVLISKSGDDYIAKRGNEPSLYQLDPKAVTDLTKAAEEVKAAASTPNK